MSLSFDNLNETQKNAVTVGKGPVLILAGAGSGKTRTLTYRIAYLIHEMGIKPSNILAVTFTNKAAREMKQRVEQLVGSGIAPLWIGTFHGICARILRLEAPNLGYEPNFSIYDVDDQVRSLKKVIGMLNVPQQNYSAKYIQNRLSKVKNKFLYPGDVSEEDLDFDPLFEYFPDIYRDYQKYLKSNNALDFDDLLMKPIELFDQFPKIKAKYARRFKYVLVDEYQDTNRAQYLLVKYLVGGHKNIYVVGDEDQSIYGWRGADLHNILNFKKDFPDARVFKLEENYRSNGNILKAANQLVENNTARIGKNLWTKRQAGNKIKIYAADDDKDEADHLVEVIHDEMFTRKRSFKDIAVLYRTNAQSRLLEDALRRNAINYNIVGGTKFYERKEIKDLLAYLKVIVNPADSISLKRIINFPLRGIGDTTVGKIEKFADMESIILYDGLGRVEEIASISPAMSGRVLEFYNLIQKFISTKDKLDPVELVSSLASETGLMHHYQTEYDQYESENRVGNIKELFNSIEQFTDERTREKRDASLDAFLEQVSLMTDVDTWNSDSNAVTLMTLHSAKGLEFPVVYITGLEMDLMPLQRASSDLDELEEERRLLYVGMTRAQESLFLSYAKIRRKFNRVVEPLASLFLDELPADLLDYGQDKKTIESESKKRKRSRKRKIQNYIDHGEENNNDESPLKIGQKVLHETFGEGKILNLEGSGDKMKITVHFIEEDIIKKLIKEYANLTPAEN